MTGRLATKRILAGVAVAAAVSGGAVGIATGDSHSRIAAPRASGHAASSLDCDAASAKKLAAQLSAHDDDTVLCASDVDILKPQTGRVYMYPTGKSGPLSDR